MKAKPAIADLTMIGWREWCSLPGLGLEWVKAKVDTGARTSALHAFDLELFAAPGSFAPMVRFSIHPLQRDTTFVVTCEAPVVDQRRVTDSGGHSEQRYVICTDIQLGQQRWPIEVTLTCRKNMEFRMLLGRKAMENRLSIHPGANFLHGRPPRGYRSAMRKAPRMHTADHLEP